MRHGAAAVLTLNVRLAGGEYVGLERRIYA